VSVSERIRRHLQSHVVGYLALFVALSGTALALPGSKQVKSNDIAKGAVKGKAIATDAVKSAKVRNGAITAPKLGAGAVTSAKLGAAAVGTEALADAAVTSAKLANDSVVREKIGQGEINGGKLANGAVDSAKVANGSLLAADFEAGQISDGLAFTTVPDFSSGTVTPFVTAPYNAPRSGRLLITASMISTSVCTGPCDDLYIALFVDGTYAPGSTRESAIGVGAGGTTSVTTSALVPLAAGPHTIEIRGISANDSQGLSNEQITGVLLQ
jgi:hypothetical protein